MNRIKEILSSRLSEQYYTDCSRGQRINNSRDAWITELALEMEDTETNDLLDLLEDSVDPKFVRGFYAEFGIDPRYPRLDYRDRQIAEALVVDAILDRKVQKMAKQLGCLKWRQCIFCPDGQELCAREVYAYAMGGAGSGS